MNDQTNNLGPDEQRDAEWIARLLQAGGSQGHVEDLDAEERAGLESWGSFLNECRSELQADVSTDQLREARLRERVLASSTREDLSLRGDWSLVRGFLSQRLRSSMLLRVVAASLLLHMVALPVMAYYTYIQPEQTSTIRFDLPGDDMDRLYEEVLPETLPGPESSAWPELDSLEGHALARRRLSDHLLAGVDWHSADAESVIWVDPLGLALLMEVRLVSDSQDGAAPSGEDLRRLSFLATKLQETLSEPESKAASPELRRYLASTWLRVRAAGLGSADADLEGDCVLWLGSVLPLEGDARTRAYEAGARALDNR